MKNTKWDIGKFVSGCVRGENIGIFEMKQTIFMSKWDEKIIKFKINYRKKSRKRKIVMGMKLDLSYLENINSAFRGQIVAYIFHDVSK